MDGLDPENTNINQIGQYLGWILVRETRHRETS